MTTRVVVVTKASEMVRPLRFIGNVVQRNTWTMSGTPSATFAVVRLRLVATAPSESGVSVPFAQRAAWDTVQGNTIVDNRLVSAEDQWAVRAALQVEVGVTDAAPRVTVSGNTLVNPQLGRELALLYDADSSASRDSGAGPAIACGLNFFGVSNSSGGGNGTTVRQRVWDELQDAALPFAQLQPVLQASPQPCSELGEEEQSAPPTEPPPTEGPAEAVYRSCLEIAEHGLARGSGLYKINLTIGRVVEAFCAFEADGAYTHVPCTALSGTSDCLRTYRATDEDTCTRNGLRMVIPRSATHWRALVSQFGKDSTWFEVVPGITPTTGTQLLQSCMRATGVSGRTWGASRGAATARGCGRRRARA